jgi:hypothetical protein
MVAHAQLHSVPGLHIPPTHTQRTLCVFVCASPLRYHALPFKYERPQNLVFVPNLSNLLSLMRSGIFRGSTGARDL